MRHASIYDRLRYHSGPELPADPAFALQFSAVAAFPVGIVWGQIVRIVSVYCRAPARYFHSGRAP
jgi:hypothetical protein